ncbi:MAG: hypothetical protein K1X89_04490 [Myxococcaceae bacterium]|nr:hypothetical protein [Myxococcaceae bacterium]
MLLFVVLVLGTTVVVWKLAGNAVDSTLENWKAQGDLELNAIAAEKAKVAEREAEVRALKDARDRVLAAPQLWAHSGCNSPGAYQPLLATVDADGTAHAVTAPAERLALMASASGPTACASLLAIDGPTQDAVLARLALPPAGEPYAELGTITQVLEARALVPTTDGRTLAIGTWHLPYHPKDGLGGGGMVAALVGPDGKLDLASVERSLAEFRLSGSARDLTVLVRPDSVLVNAADTTFELDRLGRLRRSLTHESHRNRDPSNEVELHEGPHGKALLSGIWNQAGHLVRLGDDGKEDAAFLARTDAVLQGKRVLGVRAVENDKIVIVGQGPGGATAVRLLDSGVVDPTYQATLHDEVLTGPPVFLRDGGGAFVVPAARFADGREGGSVRLLRLRADGLEDTAFSERSRTATRMKGCSIRQLLSRPDGTWLVLGPESEVACGLSPVRVHAADGSLQADQRLAKAILTLGLEPLGSGFVVKQAMVGVLAR